MTHYRYANLTPTIHSMAVLKRGVLSGAISGKVGDVVLVQYRDGRTVVRPRTVPKNPRTPAQTLARQRMKFAIALFQSLDVSQQKAWHDYAANVAKSSAGAMSPASFRPLNVFLKLTCKWLQVNGSGTPPFAPPATAFSGDAISVSVTRSGNEVTFTASGANHPGVVTELLIARVRTAFSNVPEKAYRHVAFVAFESGSLSKTVSVPSGFVVTAYRFVEPSSGQMSALTPAGTL